MERFLRSCAPTEIRTPVLGLKGLRPSPLDDGGMQAGRILPSPGLGVKTQKIRAKVGPGVGLERWVSAAYGGMAALCQSLKAY